MSPGIAGTGNTGSAGEASVRRLVSFRVFILFSSFTDMEGIQRDTDIRLRCNSVFDGNTRTRVPAEAEAQARTFEPL